MSLPYSRGRGWWREKEDKKADSFLVIGVRREAVYRDLRHTTFCTTSVDTQILHTQRKRKKQAASR